MTDNNNETQTTATPAAPKRKLGRNILIGAGTLLAIGAVGVAAAVGSGYQKGHWGKHGMMRGFAEYRMERVLDEVGASQDQKDKVKAIFTTTFDEVRPDGNFRKAMHEQMSTIMKAPTIDRAAIEKLRAERLAEMDKKSVLIAKAVGDAAEVLTPEQRLKLVETFDRMHKDGNDPE